jgi:LPXTG-motif cell wall-anchored protein
MTKNKNERKKYRSNYYRSSEHRVFCALLAVFFVAALGVGGYFAYQKFFKKDEPQASDIRDRNTASVVKDGQENSNSQSEDETDSNASKTLSEKEQDNWTKNQEKDSETGLTIAKPVIDDIYLEDNTVEISATITNVKAESLPETGGVGTTMFYMAGGIMVVCAMVLLITKKRVAR